MPLMSARPVYLVHVLIEIKIVLILLLLSGSQKHRYVTGMLGNTSLGLSGQKVE